ncbi:hypothetical protein [Actinomadura sp. 3N508]|uniref:hypothetical protein n=1 Tax=Actinomadura sp. 3N508 TaxID=3375153 RepID=UPI0037BB840A
MEDDHAEKRWEDLTDDMITLYGIIRAVLTYLPLPIQLQHFSKEWQPEETIAALHALNRARMELIPPQGLSELHTELLQAAITDWLLGYDLAGFIKLHGDPGGWRLDGLEHVIRRGEFEVGKVALDLGIAD